VRSWLPPRNVARQKSFETLSAQADLRANTSPGVAVAPD
jgi:hypothetical protein